MNILNKYISKTIIGTTSLVVLTLFAIEVFIKFTHEFPNIGSGGYGLKEVLMYVPLTLPYEVYQLFPMSGLLGSILGLGLLASHSELIVMRTSGVSLLNITASIVKTALLMAFVMLLLGEIVAPFLQQAATGLKSEKISNGQTFMTSQGIWLRDKNTFIHVEKILPDNHIQGITKYKFDDNQKLQTAAFAKDGYFKDDKWTFYEIGQTNFQNEETQSQHFPSQEWNITLPKKLLSVSSNDTEQKSLPELHSYIKYLNQSGLMSTNYEFIFWQRIFQPLSIVVMILLAIPFVFGPLRTVPMGVRMLTGVISGFAFYIINQFAGPLSTVYQFPPVLAAIFPTIVFAAIGLIMIIKIR
jgi:lipopolysaccharide export system permease protein